MTKEKKKVICDSCEQEFMIIADSSKEVSVCPFCGDEEIYVMAETDDDYDYEEDQ